MDFAAGDLGIKITAVLPHTDDANQASGTLVVTLAEFAG